MTEGLLELDLGNGKRPRDYQCKGVLECRDAVRAGHKSIILCGPTGSGKTAQACMLMKLSQEKRKRGVFLANRRELVKQASNHLADCGVFHGVILAKHDYLREPEAPWQVASKGTLAARALRRDRLKLPPCDLLIVDECHGAVATETKQLVRAFRAQTPGMVLIGLTATPCRSDDKGLGGMFEKIIQPVTYEELRQDGFLVPSDVKALFTPQMKGVKSVEWDKKAAEKVDKPKLVGDIYENWKHYASELQTVAFGKTKSHSRHICDEFRKRGVKAEHIDESTPVDERADILAALGSGDIQVLCNVGICCEGWDEPIVGAVILACPTRSLVKYRQCSGRVLRPFPGKEKALILDHAGAVFTHGMFPDDDVEWKLGDEESTQQSIAVKRASGEHKEPSHCKNCNTVYYGEQCPACGSRRYESAREVAQANGLLKTVKRKDVVDKASFTYDKKVKQWKQCLFVMAARGQTMGAAAKMYHSKVGELPWETRGLPDVCGSSSWQCKVGDVYPWYARR